jgi:cobalamin biosynthesis protein CobT
MAKKIDREAKKLEVLNFLKKSGPSLPKAIVAEIEIPIEDAKSIVAELIDEGKIRANAENKKLLEVVPAKKKAKAEPAPKTKAKAKTKKSAPVEEEEDEDEDEDEDEEDGSDEEEDDWEEDDEEADDEEADDDDEEEDDPEDEDETDDDEEDEPAPAKSKSKAGAKGKAKSKAAPTEPHKVFTMPFKPIDTLTDEELTKRIEDGVEAAESAHEDGFVEVAEMLMRSVARARKQLNKRS